MGAGGGGQGGDAHHRFSVADAYRPRGSCVVPFRVCPTFCLAKKSTRGQGRAGSAEHSAVFGDYCIYLCVYTYIHIHNFTCTHTSQNLGTTFEPLGMHRMFIAISGSLFWIRPWSRSRRNLGGTQACQQSVDLVGSVFPKLSPGPRGPAYQYGVSYMSLCYL